MEKAVGLRMEMNGYMEELLQEAGTTGEPLMRHMEYQFPGQGFWDCTDQYMLGSRYLVAPVLDDTGRRTVRLPRGTWISADGTRYKGPRVINVDVSDGSIPSSDCDNGRKKRRVPPQYRGTKDVGSVTKKKKRTE